MANIIAHPRSARESVIRRPDRIRHSGPNRRAISGASFRFLQHRPSVKPSTSPCRIEYRYSPRASVFSVALFASANATVSAETSRNFRSPLAYDRRSGRDVSHDRRDSSREPAAMIDGDRRVPLHSAGKQLFESWTNT